VYKLSEGFFFVAFSQVLTILSGFAINIFLSWHLGKELYGQFSLVTVGIIAIGQNFIASGFPETLSKYISEEKVESKILTLQLFVYLIIESIIVVGIYMAFSPLISIIFEESELTKLIIIAAPIILGQGLVSYLIGLFNGYRKFKTQALIIASLAILKVTGVLVGALIGDVLGAIIGYLISLFITAIIFLFIIKKYFLNKMIWKISKKIIFFMIQMTIFNLLAISLIQSLDMLFIKYFYPIEGNSLVGEYNAAATISRIAFYIIATLGSIMFPTISNLIANNKTEIAKERIGNMIKIASLILIPVTLIISSLSKIIISTVYGSEFQGAILINTILVIGYAILGFYLIFSSIINALGEVKYSLLVAIITILCDVLLLYFLIKSLGLIGAAIATTIASFIGFIIILIITTKKIGMKLDILSIIRINLFGGLIFGLTNYLLANLGIKIYFWILIVFGEILIYLFLLAIFKDFNIIKISKEIIRKFRKRNNNLYETDNIESNSENE